MQGMEIARTSSTDERIGSEAIVEALTEVQPRGETLGELAHDARNMVTALALYCELLEEPGVLSVQFAHYGSELRMVAEGSRRLLDRMLMLDAQQGKVQERKRRVPRVLEGTIEGPGDRCANRSWGVPPAEPVRMPIEDLREELMSNRNILSALAGPKVAVSMVACGGAAAVRMSGEELTRVLVNLVKNAAEAIGGMGAVRIALGERTDAQGRPTHLVLSVEDSGSGIPEENLEKIFDSGFSTRLKADGRDTWNARHRGLGLSITRSLVESAGGCIHAENCAEGGARIEMELPVLWQ